jgi:hypothetical protein
VADLRVLKTKKVKERRKVPTESKLNLLKTEIRLLKNRFLGPTVEFDLLVANSEAKEEYCVSADEKEKLWLATYNEALELLKYDKLDNERDGDLL